MKIERAADEDQLDKETADELVEHINKTFGGAIARLQRQLNERNGKPRDYLVSPLEHLGTFVETDDE